MTPTLAEVLAEALESGFHGAMIGTQPKGMSGNLDEQTQTRLRALEPIAMLGKPTFPHLIAAAIDDFARG